MTAEDDDLRRAFTELDMPTDRAPTLDELLALLDGSGDERDRLTTLSRAMATPDRRRELDMLRSLHDGMQDDPAVTALSASFTIQRPTGEQPRDVAPRVFLQWLRPSMLAAALLLVSLIALQRLSTRDDADVLRNAASTLRLESPADRAQARGALTFTWHHIPGATYELELYAVDGTPGIRQMTADTSVSIPAGAIPVGDTRWWVTAQLDDGTQVRSGTRRFEMK